jgi:hypothetical protein
MGNDTLTEKHNYKLTDEEFLTALRDNNGMYAPTARAIEEKYGISYSRQAVRDRAQGFPEELKLIREHIVEICETELLKCLMQNDDMKLKLKAAIFMLNSIGGNRGYGKGGIDRIAKYETRRWFS